MMLRLITVFLLFLPFTLPASAAKWKTAVKIKHYAVTGNTGRELYKSVGDNGPRLKGGRQTMAITDFDLKWRRNYKPQGNSCKLVSAKPFFTIIYTLPKPKNKLSGATARQWKMFYQGLKAHEKIHGKYAREMVQQIIDSTVGLVLKNDSKCRKIRAEVLIRVKKAYRDYKSKGRDFDRVEMIQGGNVRSLVADILRDG